MRLESYNTGLKRYKQAKIRKMHNQKKISTPKTEMGKTKLTTRYLYHENISSLVILYY